MFKPSIASILKIHKLMYLSRTRKQRDIINITLIYVIYNLTFLRRIQRKYQLRTEETCHLEWKTVQSGGIFWLVAIKYQNVSGIFANDQWSLQLYFFIHSPLVVFFPWYIIFNVYRNVLLRTGLNDIVHYCYYFPCFIIWL